MAVCCVHNFLLRDASSAAQYLPEDVNIPTSLNPTAKPHANHSSTEARSVCGSFCRYFCSAEGAVIGQDNAYNVLLPLYGPLDCVRDYPDELLPER